MWAPNVVYDIEKSIIVYYTSNIEDAVSGGVMIAVPAPAKLNVANCVRETGNSRVDGIVAPSQFWVSALRVCHFSFVEWICWSNTVCWLAGVVRISSSILMTSGFLWYPSLMNELWWWGTEDLQNQRRYDDIRVACLYNQTGYYGIRVCLYNQMVYGREKLNHEQKSRKNNEMRSLD